MSGPGNVHEGGAAVPGTGAAAGPPSQGRRRDPLLASIWAQDRNRVLGTGTGMLWHVPADFAHFKAATVGCPVIMGRRSWASLDGPLTGRHNIVLTSSTTFRAEGAEVVHSLDEALSRGLVLARQDGAPTVWITGGARVYAEAMEHVQELVVTDLDLDVGASGDPGTLIHAPEIPESLWVADPSRTDADWRPVSGDARWRVTTYVRR